MSFHYFVSINSNTHGPGCVISMGKMIPGSPFSKTVLLLSLSIGVIKNNTEVNMVKTSTGVIPVLHSIHCNNNLNKYR